MKALILICGLTAISIQPTLATTTQYNPNNTSDWWVESDVAFECVHPALSPNDLLKFEQTHGMHILAAGGGNVLNVIYWSPGANSDQDNTMYFHNQSDCLYYYNIPQTQLPVQPLNQ
jgi:hypothetical protein